MQVDVLIVGAGPTGLVLALWLARQGVSLRIVDRNSRPGETSRALVVHARILEFYRQLSLADEMVGQGIPLRAIELHAANRTTARFPLGDVGQGLSPFPFILGLPQDVHEQVLIDALKAAGVTVERETELIALEVIEDGVRASLAKSGNVEPELCDARYLCGCDGANSSTRKLIGAGFPGGTYNEVFFVADVEVANLPDRGQLDAFLGDSSFFIALPVRQSGSLRLIGIVPREKQKQAEIAFADIEPQATATTGLRIHAVNWFSTYHVHHRVADTFRRDRVFLLGDAGHIHSPVGGQGLNTGVGDAVNLAWKLAAVLKRESPPTLLDTYEPERIAFARDLVATTDRAFRVVVGRSAAAALIRRGFFLRVAPLLLRLRATGRLLFRLISQIRIEYRNSPLSSGNAGQVHGGDRLPWVPANTGDNFDPLKSRAWQIHVYGAVSASLARAAADLRIPLHQFPWSKPAEKAGLHQGAVYLVRPDGYVALADPTQDPHLLRSFVARWSDGR